MRALDEDQQHGAATSRDRRNSEDEPRRRVQHHERDRERRDDREPARRVETEDARAMRGEGECEPVARGASSSLRGIASPGHERDAPTAGDAGGIEDHAELSSRLTRRASAPLPDG
jgi:hypothetical protein